MAAFADLTAFGPLDMIEQGQQVTLSASVTNAGDAALAAFAVRWQLSTDDQLDETDDIVLDTAQITAPLAPGASTEVTRPVTIPVVPPGQYLLLVSVEWLGGFENQGSLTPILGFETDFRLADLDLPAITITMSDPASVSAAVDVLNAGSSLARANLSFILSRDRKVGNGDDILAEIGFDDPEFAPGESARVEFDVQVPAGTPSGSYYGGVVIAGAGDPTPGNNRIIRARDDVVVLGHSGSSGTFTMFGGGALDRVVTHDVGAKRASGTGFGPIPFEGDESKTHTFMVQNTGGAELNILGLEFRGQHPDDFELVGEPGMFYIPGTSTTMSVRFNPTEGGPRRANIRFLTDDPNRPVFRMRIAGQGQAPPEAPDIAVFGVGPVGSIVEIENNDTDPSLEARTDFGLASIEHGETASRSFRIQNQGEQPLLFTLSPDGISSIRAHRGEAANVFRFGQAGTRGMLEGVPATLQPGEILALELVFDPAGLGSFKPWIEIYTNDPDEQRFRFRIRGVAIP
jgi:hypothetical protein